MKICYIASPSIHTNRWVRYFADSGHDVHLITSSDSYEGDIGKTQLHYLKRVGPRLRAVSYFINALPMWFQFRKLLRDINPDIVHAQSVMDTTLLGAVSGFHPFVVNPWGSDVLVAPRQSRVSRWLVQYVLKKADAIVFKAEHMRESMIEMGADPQKIRTILWGVDTQKFQATQRDTKLREDLGLQGSLTIISTRNLEPVYDIESLIKAAPSIVKVVPQAKFLIIGDGSQAAELKQLADSLGVSDNFRFIGRIGEDLVPRYLASADIYVSTALSDAGLALSTAEAMACELPAVITDFGDNSKWVADGESGFIFPLQAPEALAAKIIYLLQNEDSRRKFGKAARRVIEERNNREREMARMGDLYRELVERWKR